VFLSGQPFVLAEEVKHWLYRLQIPCGLMQTLAAKPPLIGH